MKTHRLMLVVVCLLVAPALLAQWEPPANNQTTTLNKVGIGTGPSTTITKQLEVFGDANFTGFVTTFGSVGIGTATPGQNANLSVNQEAPLHIVSTQNKNTILLVQNMTNDSWVAPTVRTMADLATQNFQSHASGRTIQRFGVTLGGWNEFLSVSGNGLILGTLGPVPMILGTNTTSRVHSTSAGSVGIGVTPNAAYLLDVNGATHIANNLTVDGNIAAKYQDVAEWVPAIGDLTPGTVVIVAPERMNNVSASSEAYDTRVAGVVSGQPGMILGEGGPSKVMVATTGRVKVHVDATNAPVRAGDLLVSSSKLGVAMKSQPVDINGVKFHRPGTVIGKALEPLANGEGDILVLLSLQ